MSQTRPTPPRPFLRPARLHTSPPIVGRTAAAWSRRRMFGSGAARSDLGHVRWRNEDAFGVAPSHGAYAVCDGMGGHPAGDIASELAALTMMDFMTAGPTGLTPEDSVYEALHLASEKVFDRATQAPDLLGMGTTGVLLLDALDRVVVGHVGDSRAYRWRPSEGLTRLTRDHGLAEELISAGVPRDDAMMAYYGHVLTQALGRRNISPSVTTLERRPGDRYLLCTDGLTRMCEDGLIAEAFERRSEVAAQAEMLVKSARLRGGHDNITVVVVAVPHVACSA